VISFSFSLSGANKEAFLTMLSGLCWSIWKLKNSIIFKQSHIPSIRNMLILICSLIDYWAGMMDEVVKRQLKKWLSVSLEMIPLQVLEPMMRLE
jgi:hypothetical protein